MQHQLSKSNYKAIFSDIDGTLLNSNHQISAKTAQSVRRVLQQGIPFILTSARPPLAITPFNQQLESNSPIVCYSGALILDADLQPIYSVEIDPHDLSALEFRLEQDSSLSVNYYAGVEWFCPNPENDWTVQEGIITHLQADKKPENLANVHKILVMAQADQILALEKALKAEFPHLSIHRSKDEYLEIMNKAATKSSAIRFMEKVLNVTNDEIIAFGDNYNDLDMLQYAGLGVAMGNAPEPIKQVVERVTLDNESDGLAVVLDELF